MLSRFKEKVRRKQAEQYIKKLYYPFDENWFKGKRVAIIGGADSVLKEKNGAKIDKYDVVVRINKGVEIIDTQKKYVGSKTDVLFHSFMDNPGEPGSSPITTDLWKKHKVGKIIYSLNHSEETKGIYDIIRFAKKSVAETKFSEVPSRLHKKNKKSIAPYWPTTGHIAINTIFCCRPKEIFVTGLTFFKTPHNKAYRKTGKQVEDEFAKKPGAHYPDAEYQHFKKLYLANKEVIKVDQTLQKIIKTN